MKKALFSLFGIFSLFLFGVAAPTVFAEDCMSFPYSNEQGENAGQQIVSAAQKLLAEIEANYPRGEEDIVDTNYEYRSYVWLRSTFTFDEPYNSFAEMKYSECLRKDLRDIDDLIGEIELAIQKSKLMSIENMDALQNEILPKFTALKETRTKLSKCATKEENSVYYDAHYPKQGCTPKDGPLFSATASSFHELQRKIKGLMDGSGWSGVDQAWEDISEELNSGEKDVTDLDRQAQQDAENWFTNQYLPNFVSIEKFDRSLLRMRDELQKIRDNIEYEAAQRASRQNSEAVQQDQIYTALRAVENNIKEQRAQIEENELTLDETIFTSYEYSIARYWRDSVLLTENHVQDQTAHLKNIEKSLKSLLSNQARNKRN